MTTSGAESDSLYFSLCLWVVILCPACVRLGL